MEESAVFEQLKDILELTESVGSSPDKDVLVPYILHAISKAIQIDQVIFFLPDESGKFADMRPLNADESRFGDFRQYYYQFDPYDLIKESTCQRYVIRLDELVPHKTLLSSEYYNDFLRPQEVFYKAVCYLRSQHKCYAKIALLRSRKRQNFDSREMSILSLIAAHLGNFFRTLELSKEIQLMEDICSTVSQGILLLDYSMKLIYVNDKADQILSRFGFRQLGQHNCCEVPSLFLGGCYAIRNEIAKSGTDVTAMPGSKLIKILDAGRYGVCSQLICKNLGLANDKLFLISIKETRYPERQVFEMCKYVYGLTDREIDVIAGVYKSLTNAEIAEKLCTAEITIKKHLENIYRKVHVINRVDLVRRTGDVIQFSP
jgi:DNA-binding CsgD family transcriptional regulator